MAQNFYAYTKEWEDCSKCQMKHIAAIENTMNGILHEHLHGTCVATFSDEVDGDTEQASICGDDDVLFQWR